jgi:phosphatidylserine decarboxylase
MLTHLLIVVTVFLAVPACASSSMPWNASHAPVVRLFEAALRNDGELYAAVLTSLTQSQAHGWNSSDPWDVDRLLQGFDDYLYFIPTPDHPLHALNQLGDIWNFDVWSSSATALAFLHDFVTARSMFLYSAATEAVVSAWTSSPNVTMSDFIVPPNGFPSWGAFFTRDVTATARPTAGVGNASVVCSPVDGTVDLIVALLGADDELNVKGPWPVNITTLLGGNRTAAEPFVGGTGILIMLGVFDYHKWHSPVDGIVESVSRVGGGYYAVPPTSMWFPYLGYYFNRSPFVIHNDVLSFDVAVIPVGIAEYGSTVPYISTGDRVSKGQLVGQFDLGGSALYLAFDSTVNVDIIVSSGQIEAGAALAVVSKKY